MNMRLLLYCIFPQTPGRPTDGLRGVDLQPVLEVGSTGLSAAVSQVNRMAALQEVPQILIYESVISALHRQHPLIPMRFGCLMDDPSTIVGLLRERRDEYLRTLSEITDCEEIGIHILLDKHTAQNGRFEEPIASRPPLGCAPRAGGLAYLTSRRRHYDSIDKEGLKRQKLMERFRSDLAGLFLRFRVDEHKSDISCLPSSMHMVSFRFLVHRTLLGVFYAAAEHSLTQMDERSFLGEPCPPYSFVSP